MFYVAFVKGDKVEEMWCDKAAVNHGLSCGTIPRDAWIFNEDEGKVCYVDENGEVA